MIKDLIQISIMGIAVSAVVNYFGNNIFLQVFGLFFCAFCGWNYNKLNSIKIF